MSQGDLPLTAPKKKVKWTTKYDLRAYKSMPPGWSPMWGTPYSLLEDRSVVLVTETEKECIVERWPIREVRALRPQDPVVYGHRR